MTIGFSLVGIKARQLKVYVQLYFVYIFIQ
jgi:hypothetical protein